VRNVRQDLGLPDLPPAGLPGEAAPTTGVGETPMPTGENPAANPATGTVGAGAPVPTVPSDVKPEDREVVRRYFGG
jgi:hypothetical protein